MSLWLVRAGKYGEHEKRFLDEKRIYLTWWGLDHDLTSLGDQKELRTLLEEKRPDAPKNRIGSHVGQIWRFCKEIHLGDWIIVPSKQRSSIHVANVKGDYVFNRDGEDPYYHYRDVEWVVQDVPRSNFDQDLLSSFNAIMTICQIYRNDAERRVREMAANDWKPSGVISTPTTREEEEDPESDERLNDLEEAARDQLTKLIIARFKGHGMARLVDAVLRAQGYTTYLSPEGPDKGIDLLAALEPMGFGQPRVCVQVKSGDSPLDRPTLDQLIGVMQNVQADHGLLVSWGGFKSSVDREKATQFFRVRLWDQGDIIDQVLTNYEKLDEEIKTQLPLKRIWVVKNEPVE